MTSWLGIITGAILSCLQNFADAAPLNNTGSECCDGEAQGEAPGLSDFSCFYVVCFSVWKPEELSVTLILSPPPYLSLLSSLSLNYLLKSQYYILLR